MRKTIYKFSCLLSIPAIILCAALLRGAQDTASASALPPAGTYKIDPIHSFTYFSAWHHVVGVVRGRFEIASGTITVAPDPAACDVDLEIASYSVNTQDSDRDNDLRGPAFFEVAKYPTMTYRGRGIRPAANGSWILDGSLTIRGVSKVVPLTFTYKGNFKDMPPGKPMRVSFHGTAATKRGDFGMTRDNLMELGQPPARGNDVDIEIDVEANATTPT